MLINQRITIENCQAILVDIQERLTPHIDNHKCLLNKVMILIQGLQALNIPIMVNEQYRKGLGQTLPELLALFDSNQQIFEKTTFSVCDTPASWQHIDKQNRDIVLLFGTEAHVCVMQTALDLLDNGLQPVLIADAVGSRNPLDKQFAIDRMRQAGVVITTTESILFELCRDSKNPTFKAISQLVK